MFFISAWGVWFPPSCQRLLNWKNIRLRIKLSVRSANYQSEWFRLPKKRVDFVFFFFSWSELQELNLSFKALIWTAGPGSAPWTLSFDKYTRRSNHFSVKLRFVMIDILTQKRHIYSQKIQWTLITEIINNRQPFSSFRQRNTHVGCRCKAVC